MIFAQIAAFIFSCISLAGVEPKTDLEHDEHRQTSAAEELPLFAETDEILDEHFIGCVIDPSQEIEKCSFCCLTYLSGTDARFDQKMHLCKFCGCNQHSCGDEDGFSLKICGTYCYRCVDYSENSDCEIGPLGCICSQRKNKCSFLMCVNSDDTEVKVCNILCSKETPNENQCGPCGCIYHGKDGQTINLCCGSCKIFNNQQGWFYKLAKIFRSNDEPTGCCCVCVCCYENGCNIACISCGSWGSETPMAPSSDGMTE